MGTQKTFSGSLASHDERIELDCSTSVPSPDASSEKVSLQPRCPLEDDDIFEAPPTDSADSRVTHVMPQATEECEVGVPPTHSIVTHLMSQPTLVSDEAVVRQRPPRRLAAARWKVPHCDSQQAGVG